MVSPFVFVALALIPSGAVGQNRPATPAQATATEGADEGEDIVVQATRTGRRVQDEPIRVEVLDREEIEEKILMQPGNIAMLVSETPGIRVQVTSPALGAANVRVQGLKGRYTQILADGLPLYGGQTPSIGLLQIPPTDLGQVEIIKVAASITGAAGRAAIEHDQSWRTGRKRLQFRPADRCDQLLADRRVQPAGRAGHRRR